MAADTASDWPMANLGTIRWLICCIFGQRTDGATICKPLCPHTRIVGQQAPGEDGKKIRRAMRAMERESESFGEGKPCVVIRILFLALMTGRKNRALQVPPFVPYKALGNFSKALYGTTGGTSSARFFRPIMCGACSQANARNALRTCRNRRH